MLRGTHHDHASMAQTTHANLVEARHEAVRLLREGAPCAQLTYAIASMQRLVGKLETHLDHADPAKLVSEHLRALVRDLHKREREEWGRARAVSAVFMRRCLRATQQTPAPRTRTRFDLLEVDGAPIRRRRRRR